MALHMNAGKFLRVFAGHDLGLFVLSRSRSSLLSESGLYENTDQKQGKEENRVRCDRGDKVCSRPGGGDNDDVAMEQENDPREYQSDRAGQ